MIFKCTRTAFYSIKIEARQRDLAYAIVKNRSKINSTPSTTKSETSHHSVIVLTAQHAAKKKTLLTLA